MDCLPLVVALTIKSKNIKIKMPKLFVLDPKCHILRPTQRTRIAESDNYMGVVK